MASQRITITVPESIGAIVRKRARLEKKPVSRVFGEAIEETERKRIEDLMAEGYREASALNKELAEEALPAVREVLPPD
jgi:hypothetical protein